MESFQLLRSLGETLPGADVFITHNGKSDRFKEDGNICESMGQLDSHLVVGIPIIGGRYLLSEIPLYELVPDLIFAHDDGGSASMFCYLIEDAPEWDGDDDE